MYTYKGQGVSKQGLKESEIQHHAVLYTKDKDVLLLEEEKQYEPIMRAPFPVNTAGKDTLEPTSRIRFDMPYPVKYNLKVYDLGRVSSDHLFRLTKCYKDAC